MNHNFFYQEADQTAFRRKGWDTESSYGDPQFIDPANGDYRVKEGSPALKAGFKNFPMDRFGVKKPALKAIARTPKLPHYRYDPGKPSDAKQAARRKTIKWLGAFTTTCEGEEFSAFGVNKEDGGLLIKRIDKGSPLESAKLLVEDVIQTINGSQRQGPSKPEESHLKPEKRPGGQDRLRSLPGEPDTELYHP